MLFFFFKQKTAYEMRISDWSSDVCSSDLSDLLSVVYLPATSGGRPVMPFEPGCRILYTGSPGLVQLMPVPVGAPGSSVRLPKSLWSVQKPKGSGVAQLPPERSEEHTSELQSLMRISYAVFCLKKKKSYKHKASDTYRN